MLGKDPGNTNTPRGRWDTVSRAWAECGWGGGSGQAFCGLLSFRPCHPLLPFKPQRRGQGRVESTATTQGSEAPGRGALWESAEGSLGAKLQTLPMSGAALVLICHVHCDLFPGRSGLNKGSAAEKRFKTTKPALAFTGLTKKVDSGEGTWPATASQAPVRGDSGVAPVLSGVCSSLVINHTQLGRMLEFPFSAENTSHGPQAWSGPQADLTWPVVFIFRNSSQLGDFPFNVETLLSLTTLNIR